ATSGAGTTPDSPLSLLKCSVCGASRVSVDRRAVQHGGETNYAIFVGAKAAYAGGVEDRGRATNRVPLVRRAAGGVADGKVVTALGGACGVGLGQRPVNHASIGSGRATGRATRGCGGS